LTYRSEVYRMGNLIKNLLTKEDLAAIVSAIGEAEKTTAGEIRVSIRQKRRWREKKLNIEEIARQEFINLEMAKTRDKTGVLIFLLVEEKKFYIFADAGIHTKVKESTWDKIADDMSSHFAKKNFQQGIIHGIQEASVVLSQFFPRKSNDIDELPNTVRVS
jgi:uncharacterized membrane protein